MDEFGYVEPGYPVYRAYIIPRSLDDRYTHVRRLTEQDVVSWGKTLDKLREFLTNVNNYTTEKLGLDLEPVERLEMLADCIVLFFKIPLLREVLPTVAPNPLKTYLMNRLLWKSMRESLPGPPTDFTLRFYGSPSREFSRSSVAEVFNDTKLISMVEDAWLNIPADTRPAANTSALVPHMFLTSSIAWSLAVDRGVNRLEAAKLRLSAMLHDIGKPFNYRRHYEISPKIAEHLLSNIISDSELEGVINAVRDHHQKGTLHEADRIAAGLDRLQHYVSQTIKEKITRAASTAGLDPKMAYSSGEEAWNFWAEIEKSNPDMLKELSFEFAKQVYQGEVVLGGRREQYDRYVLSLFLFDVGGIQEFIKRASELRCVIASSIVIDIATMAHIPLIIQKVLEEREKIWFPLESFLYTSGGVVTLLAPISLEETVKQVYSTLRDQYRKDRIKIYMASAYLRDEYSETTKRLGSSIVLEKLKEDTAYKPTELDANNLCELCRIENQKDTISSTGERVCETCYKLYLIGDELHFRQRWEAELLYDGERLSPQHVFENMAWNSLSLGIMELLSGHTVNDLMKLGLVAGKPSEKPRLAARPRIRNIGIVKMDGNLMGSFFANSISITDALERSARVDIALKKALGEAIHSIARTLNDKAEARCFVALLSLGIMYVGGDDALLMCPSWAAIPLASNIGRVFYREMGGSASLSIGVLATSPKHDVWASISAVSKILDIAKVLGRKSASGGVCYDVIEGGVVSASSVQERHESLKDRKLTAQPLPLNIQDKSWYSLDQFIELLCRHSCGSMADINTLAFQASRETENDVKKTLKKIRTAIMKSVQAGETLRTSLDWQPYTAVYTFKMGGGVEYETVRELIRMWLEIKQNQPHRSDDVGIPLGDVDLLIKMLGGGTL